MGIIFTNLQKEIVPVVIYEGSEDYQGIIICKCREKSIINRNNEHLYLDLKSYANEIGVTERELLEQIDYGIGVKSYIAYYRDEKLRVVKVLEVRGLDDLYRLLKVTGTDLKLLKKTKEKVNEMINRIEEKEEKEHGEN
ncbi:hypothetical protein [Bacillus coreaensis]